MLLSSTMILRHKCKLLSFENKLLKVIGGSVRDNLNREWRQRAAVELRERLQILL